jgi:hypothetical protein
MDGFLLFVLLANICESGYISSRPKPLQQQGFSIPNSWASNIDKGIPLGIPSVRAPQWG